MATPPLLKRLNEEAVLHAIRAAAPISRAQISRRSGISKPTVSTALQSLLNAGLVRETPATPGGPHYGAVYFEPVDEAALVFGVDLGARFLRGVLGDLAGRIRARQDVQLDVADADRALDAIVTLRATLAETADLAASLAEETVVGVPGVVEQADGTVRLALNVAGLDGRRFGGELRERLGGRVTVENDVNLAALGEGSLGVARGSEDFVFLSVGTGLGAGLVVRGDLQRGHHGAAGELDYVRAGLDQDLDPCAAALSALAERLADGKRTTIAPPYEPRAVFAAARDGDDVAHAVVEEEARRIALHVVPIASVTDVGLVVLGGGIGANAELLEPVRRLLRDWLPYPPRVEMSSLGDGAVLTGALSIGVRSALETVFDSRRA
ncbi:MAG TPA: ROK family transcriptional regulator [Gaiellaceae bacterium]|nr:ROK family transcriptional regulator [Gaiellaceae bacterium]